MFEASIAVDDGTHVCLLLGGCRQAQRSCEQELSKLKQHIDREVASRGFSGMTQSLMTSPITTPPLATGVTTTMKERLRKAEAVNILYTSNLSPPALHEIQ